MPEPTRTTQWLPAFVALSFIWGSSFALIKVALAGGVSPSYISLYRCFFGAVLLWGIVLFSRTDVIRDRKVWAHSFALAFLFNTVPFTLIAFAETEITSVLTGVLNATTPFFTLLFSMALLKNQSLGRTRTISLVIGFVGVVTVLGVWETTQVRWGGALAVILGSACYGLGYVYMRSRFSGRQETAAALSAAQITCACLQLAILAPALSGAPVWPGWAAVGALVFLGALGTGVAYVFNYQVVRQAGQTVASTVTYMATLVAAAFGILVLSEHVEWHTLVGGALIIGGLVLNTLAGRRVARVPETAA